MCENTANCKERDKKGFVYCSAGVYQPPYKTN